MKVRKAKKSRNNILKKVILVTRWSKKIKIIIHNFELVHTTLCINFLFLFCKTSDAKGLKQKCDLILSTS